MTDDGMGKKIQAVGGWMAVYHDGLILAAPVRREDTSGVETLISVSSHGLCWFLYLKVKEITALKV